MVPGAGIGAVEAASEKAQKKMISNKCTLIQTEEKEMKN